MEKIRDYMVLGKPRVTVLLAFTAISAYIYGAETISLINTIIIILLSFLSPMGANAINNYIDREIDRKMRRTKNRPLPRGVIPPLHALILGITLIIISAISFHVFFNIYAAILSVIGAIYYIIVYTVVLKRKTPWNTVVGGIAGSFPPLTGWVAATGNLSGAPGLLMALTIFFWNPAHFWGLAMKLRDEYHSVGLPMFPVTFGNKTTSRYIGLFSALTILTMLVQAIISSNIIIWITVLISSFLLAMSSFIVLKNPSKEGGYKSFKLSSPALGIFFLGILISGIKI